MLSILTRHTTAWMVRPVMNVFGLRLSDDSQGPIQVSFGSPETMGDINAKLFDTAQTLGIPRNPATVSILEIVSSVAQSQ